jgi:Ser/Thr protein kinase RdoA (MazF antagonist)
VNASEAAAAFEVAGSVVSVVPHPSGHINDGYLVVTDRGRYLLQRLNPSVFADPDAVMANVVVVTDHLRAKGEPTLALVDSRNGAPSWHDDSGAPWRMYEYIGDAHPLAVETAGDAALVGRTFGHFHRLLDDLDPDSLRVSLPGFHDPARRVAQLESALDDDQHGRSAEAGPLVDELLQLRRLAAEGEALLRLPARVAHNDAKAANLLVDECGKNAPVVVDLDTLMAGSILWDVGDMVRSSTGTADEAAPGVRFDGERYRALVDGWLSEVAELLTTAERAALPVAGPVVTFEQAVRFVTDHLRGDVYFRVGFPGENLLRARNQFELLRSMLSILDKGRP